MGEETAGDLEGEEDQNEAAEDKNQLLEDDGAEVERPVLLFLLGADAHHRRDNQRGLDAIDEEHRHPGQREDSKLAQAHEAEKHYTGEEVRRADHRLVCQRPGFPPQELAQKTVPNSFKKRKFSAHPSPGKNWL